GLKSRVHRRTFRNRELSDAQNAANTTRSKVSSRVEHGFCDKHKGMAAELVRTIGIVRARCKIGMTNLVYNMRRFVCLERMAAAAGSTGAPWVSAGGAGGRKSPPKTRRQLQTASIRGRGSNNADHHTIGGYFSRCL